MPDIHCGKQNKLSKNMGSPLDTMGEIISTRCPSTHFLKKILYHMIIKKVCKDQELKQSNIKIKNFIEHRV